MEGKSRFPTGVELIERGECPREAFAPIVCMSCPYGHMLECHYPYECDEVECSHYLAELEAEEAVYPPGEEDIP